MPDSAPRPILKRVPAPAHGPHTVHFPPSPVLARACTAYSPAVYDRTPITVEANACALPARGCPGRTYTICGARKRAAADAAAAAVASGSGSGSVNVYAGSRALHPRAHAAAAAVAVAAALPDALARRLAPESAPLLLAVPPLVRDASSEESDESDGPVSPPPERAPPLAGAAYAYTFDGSIPRSAAPAMDAKPQNARPRRRRPHAAVTPGALSLRLAACRLDDEDEGCLAGF